MMPVSTESVLVFIQKIEYSRRMIEAAIAEVDQPNEAA